MNIERLQTISTFADLPEHDLKQIALLATEQSVSEGTDLVKQGGYSNHVIGIIDGTADVKHDGELVATLKAGDVFGEMGVIEKTQRGATVTATSSMSVVSLGSLEINRLRKTAPEVITRLEAVVESRRPT